MDDELILVAPNDSSRTVYECMVEMANYAIPSYMKTSYVVSELRRIVQSPHRCIYDGLLGMPTMDVGALCQRVASCRFRHPSCHTVHLFVPLRLEHWLVRHLVTIHLHTGDRRVEYYDPTGASYDQEARVIVGLAQNGESVTPRILVETLMGALPGWTASSVGRRQQGIFSPLSCGQWNLQYISEHAAGVVPAAHLSE
jgi:hypothetical protein